MRAPDFTANVKKATVGAVASAASVKKAAVVAVAVAVP
jgi:hypothetical protein